MVFLDSGQEIGVCFANGLASVTADNAERKSGMWGHACLTMVCKDCKTRIKQMFYISAWEYLQNVKCVSLWTD